MPKDGMSLADDLDDGLSYQFEDPNEKLPESDPGKTSSKRPLEDENVNEPPKKVSKRKQKLEKSKLHEKKLEKLEYEKLQKKLLPRLSSEELAEHIASLIRSKNPSLSALELDELYLKKSDFIATSDYDKDRTLENFADFVSKHSNAPRAIVFSVSNIRVADVFRSLGGSKNAIKFFSKNKYNDDLKAAEELWNGPKKSKGKAALPLKYILTTPSRMSRIIKNTDALFSGKDKLDIIIDASYLDPKMNTIFTGEDNGVLVSTLKEFTTKKSSVKIILF
ncbi:LAMI_0H09406g1_1 [Lachancea mirantina]|uniref:LAMI_0H09406g1_1 n=1 Tax=Lachancea mirantina TaxID=1230905 RepID=A0A1G4KGH6_9SACH|nr:LAMI_0H09406g1_1 [Lachancea mirantina]